MSGLLSATFSSESAGSESSAAKERIDVAAGADGVPQNESIKAYLTGGGIASLASAAYLIQAGGVPGPNITILEASELLGGSLDGKGSPEHSYVIRGGRMFTEEAYTCMFDLLSFIPSLTTNGMSVKDEIYEFNSRIKSNSLCRLVKDGQKIDASHMGLSNADRMELISIMATSEDTLGAKRIEDIFELSFFKTNFWYMWCTTFAFQPWHSAVELKRYLLRFMQEFPRIHTLAGVRRTPYNQYDSIVLPITEWLVQHGVQFVTGTQVTNLDFNHGQDGKAVERIHTVSHGAEDSIVVRDIDLVFVTNGSMTAASTQGSMTEPARLASKEEDGSWALWETLVQDNPEFGNPAAFNSNVAESKWLSFTVTLTDPVFFNLMEQFTGNLAGTGGLVTIMDSNWLMSVVLPYQPHFLNQPPEMDVFWGYGLFPDIEGNFIKKKMSDCSGEEILNELCRHLRFDFHRPHIIKSANCIPSMMPYITSQFMPRVKGDRPDVRPTGTTNIAFIGQYCELPDDVVFTVEYSVRSAQTAVFSLLGVDKEVSSLYKAEHDLEIVLKSLATLFH